MEQSSLSTTLTWRAHLTFDVQVRGHHLVTDALAPHGDDHGPSPMELLLAAVAGCTAMDVVSILAKQRTSLRRLVVRCEGDRAAEHPRRLTALRLTYEVQGDDVQREAVERAVQLSLQRYCSVLSTLGQAPELATSIVLAAESS